MKSIFSAGTFHAGGYVCNIDLSKAVQVKGVTNLSTVPILQVHSSVPYAGDGQAGTSALDSPLPQSSIKQRDGAGHENWVTPNLNLNLI